MLTVIEVLSRYRSAAQLMMTTIRNVDVSFIIIARDRSRAVDECVCVSPPYLIVIEWGTRCERLTEG